MLKRQDTDATTEDYDPYAELVREQSPYLFCDACGFYPIAPEHAHFVCPQCRTRTSCCEGGPLES